MTEPEPEPTGAMPTELPESGADAVTEPLVTDPESGPQSGADSDPGETDEADLEGPRRRARRERAERRVAQTRARAIEDARREAKRQVAGRLVDQPKPVARGVIRGLKMLLGSILLVVLGVGLALVLYFTPLMSARSVVVAGTVAVTPEEVLDAAQVKVGTPLLQINTNEVADRVAAIRRVAVARVQRQYPSALKITITERIPLAVKDLADGPHLFDRDGVDFATAPPPPGLTYLDVADPGSADPATKAALQVLTALRPEVAGQVGRIAAPSVASITLTFSDGRVVIWGTMDRTEEKAEKLAALLTQPGRTYDLSSPDLPTVK
jgi:cell division protein FtsQ